jgi:hypothetical protein
MMLDFTCRGSLVEKCDQSARTYVFRWVGFPRRSSKTATINFIISGEDYVDQA